MGCVKTFGLLLAAVGFWLVTGVRYNPFGIAFYLSAFLILLCVVLFIGKGLYG